MRDYYINNEPISSHPAGISAVGTTCSVSLDSRSGTSHVNDVKSILYLAAPPFFVAFRRWPRFCRWCPPFGLVIAVLAIGLSSFATSVWQLILTQGVLLGLGGCFLYFPIYTFIDQWFVRRKGFAYGVMWAGSGCGGLSGPLVMNWGLSRFGSQTLLRGWSIALVSNSGDLAPSTKLIV